MSIPGIPEISYPSDMKAMVERLRQDTLAMDAAIQACGAVDMNTRAQWGDFYVSVMDFTAANADPGILDMTSSLTGRIVGYAEQLKGWRKNLGAACNLPPIGEQTSLLATVQPALDTVKQIVQYAAIGAAVLGGAYAVGKVVELLPHPLFPGVSSKRLPR